MASMTGIDNVNRNLL